MSVIIPNMKMPMSCLVCPLAREMFGCLVCVGYFKDSLTGRRVYKSDLKESDADFNRPDWCPLISLPEGHGRLIDADAVVKTICNSCDGKCEVVQCDCLNCKADCRCDIVKEISDAQTIIEADLEWKMKNCCCFRNTDQAEGDTE